LCSSIDLIRGIFKLIISIFFLFFKEIISQLQVASQNYDYDENTPGNGFRFFISRKFFFDFIF